MKIKVKNLKIYNTDGQLIAQAESGAVNTTEDGHSCETCAYNKRPKPYEPCARCLWHGRRTRWKAKKEVMP